MANWSPLYRCHQPPKKALLEATSFGSQRGSLADGQLQGLFLGLLQRWKSGLKIATMWCPPNVTSWFITPSNYGYYYHKP